MEAKLSKKDVLAKIKALGKISDAQKREIICSLIGHSNILTGCFGYMYCARCEAQVGDTLGGAYTNDRAVIVGHNCETCRANYERMDWRDKWLCPNPFKAERAQPKGE